MVLVLSVMCGTLVMLVRLVRLSAQVKVRIRTVCCPYSARSSGVRIVVFLITSVTSGIVVFLVTPVMSETHVTLVVLVPWG